MPSAAAIRMTTANPAEMRVPIFQLFMTVPKDSFFMSFFSWRSGSGFRDIFRGHRSTPALAIGEVHHTGDIEDERHPAIPHHSGARDDLNVPEEFPKSLDNGLVGAHDAV